MWVQVPPRAPSDTMYNLKAGYTSGQSGRAHIPSPKGFVGSNPTPATRITMYLLLLGKNEKYLDYKRFSSEEELHSFLEKIEPLVMANIDGELSLKERLALIPSEIGYFAFAGAVQGFEFIDEE